MSAASQTWTLDVANLLYIDRNKIEHIINTNETFKLTFTDTGTGGIFIGTIGGGAITCTDGFEFTIECDPRFNFASSADGSATKDNGEICFVEDGNVRHPFNVKSLNMANADGVASNNITEIILESKLHGGLMTWTNINSA